MQGGPAHNQSASDPTAERITPVLVVGLCANLLCRVNYRFRVSNLEVMRVM
jgi:hypothetical protein